MWEIKGIKSNFVGFLGDVLQTQRFPEVTSITVLIDDVVEIEATNDWYREVPAGMTNELLRSHQFKHLDGVDCPFNTAVQPQNGIVGGERKGWHRW